MHLSVDDAGLHRRAPRLADSDPAAGLCTRPQPGRGACSVMKNSLETSPPAPPANSKPRCGTSWTASSVLDEDPRDTVRREVLEETCVTVKTGQLTGVYKNMR